MSNAKRVQASLLAGLVMVCLGAAPASAQLSVAPPPIKSYAGDPARLGDPASWRTPEFLRDNGMLSIGAEFAYAAGYAGAGMNIGVVDSGVFAGHVREHGSLDTNYAIGDRYFGVIAQGGDTGPTSGFYNQTFNDTHGTHVTGTIGASRDGVGETTPAGPTANMHGVAFNADLYVGNTAKTDGVLYGFLPANATVADKPDNAYIGNVYRAVNATIGRDGKPVRIITSSWGSQPSTENYNTLETPAGRPASEGLNVGENFLSKPDGQPDANGTTSHWLNGAFDAARSGTIIQFTAGNTGYVNPSPRASAPYYYPDLEKSYYTTSGVNPGQGRTLNPDGSVLVPGRQSFNQCGIMKWNCVTAPANTINSTEVSVVNGVPTPIYRAESGTSMAGPHSAAVLALIMQRFPYMTNSQAMYTMFTTGRQNDTINNAAGTAITNPQRGQIVQVPDNRNGWGTVSLREAMRGPGQLVGPTDIDTKGYSDVWSNNVTDVAIQARRTDDTAEATAWAQTLAAKGWTNGVPADASDQDKFDYATGVRREAARNARIYTGSLTKDGDGTLFLTGDDGWHGTTTVKGGKLSIVGTLSNPVDVSGGTLGGSGTVGAINVAGTLAPGLAPDEAARITDVTVAPGNVLNVAGDAKLAGHLAITARSATDYTSLRATGDLVLNGVLDLDVKAPLTPGTALTIAKGRSITGTFAGLAQGSFLKTGGVTFLVSYLDNAVTLIVASTADGTVGGSVPATLSLTLGNAATFGAFTPGAAKDYTASTTANVISTAGDATLSVSPPGHLMNGSFSLPEPLVVEFSKSTWTAPVASDPVTITFKQHVGATDPLRTGVYTKTLTFTLSTTTP